MTEPRELLAAREHLARAEAAYGSAAGLAELEQGLGLLDDLMSGKDARQRSIAQNIATTYASRIFRSIGAVLDGDRAVPEPQLEHLFKVVLAFDQSDIELPPAARTIKIEIARRLIDRYYEGHSPEAKRKALEQLTRIAQ
ncbi:MAG TPA: hypothetical protein VJQ52_24675 [Steroidobacteraceae bacterium]|nr:hypothetical protein [Steroidobacteraceae bacterium]